MSDRAGLPLAVAISAVNTNDSYALKPLVMAIPSIKSRRGPRRRKPSKLHADKAYDQPDRRCWIRDRGIKVRVARKGIATMSAAMADCWELRNVEPERNVVVP
jgi:hypothetical protein